MAVQKRLNKSPLYEQAYMALKEDIMNGRLKVGEKLTDQGLAELLGISRTPIREAVRQLVKEGLLMGAPNRSVTVFSPNARDIAEVYVIRSGLEGLAAGLAALRPDRSFITEKMSQIGKEAKQYADNQDAGMVARKNTEFHDLLIKASGCDSLVSLLEPIRNKAFICRLSSMRNQASVHVSLQEHEEIIKCLMEGDSQRTEQLVRHHVTMAGKRLLMRLHAKELNEPDSVFRYYQELATENGGLKA